MGRHATPAADTGTEITRMSRFAAFLVRLLQRVLLALTGAVATALAVAWAGNTWHSAAIAGAAAGLVVLVAAWLGSTVPGPPPESPPDEGPDPVQ